MLTELLKLQTRAQHRAMEESNPVPNSRDEYVGRLIAFFGFVAPWEERVAMALPETDPIRLGRAKTRWLEEDLEVFGYDSEQRRRLPRTNSLPSTSSRNHILGASYVLEGSTLGGQMITRHISRMLGLSGTHGCRFFSSYGIHVGSQWQAFREELLRASSPTNDRVILDAAENTFSLLHQWFTQAKAVS